jgi:hypothetical protein
MKWSDGGGVLELVLYRVDESGKADCYYKINWELNVSNEISMEYANYAYEPRAHQMSLTNSGSIPTGIQDRVTEALRTGCACRGRSATLVQRYCGNGGHRVQLQCDGCLRARTHGLPLAAIPDWQYLPEWRMR